MPNHDTNKSVPNVSANSDAPAQPRLPPARVRVRKPSAEAVVIAPTPQPPKRDYEVGYGKPPKHTQFKPGNRANPRGRPKESKNFKTIVGEELSQPVSARLSGRSVTMDVRRASTKAMIQKALAGNLQAWLALVKMEADAAPADVASKPATSEPLSPEVKRLLDQFLSELEGEGDKSGGRS